MFIIVTRYRLNSARLMSPGDSGPGLPEESPVLGSQSFSLWRKLLTIGRYPQTLASTVLIEGQKHADGPAWPIFVTWSHLLQRPRSNTRLGTVILRLEVISQEPSNGPALLRGGEV